MDDHCDIQRVAKALGQMRAQFKYVLKEAEGWPDVTLPRVVLDNVCRVCCTACESLWFDVLPELRVMSEKLAYAGVVERVSPATPKDPEDPGWTMLGYCSRGPARPQSGCSTSLASSSAGATRQGQITVPRVPWVADAGATASRGNGTSELWRVSVNQN